MLCFQIGLIEAWEPLVAVIRLKFSVDVLCLVAWVHIVLEALTIGHIHTFKLDYYFIVAYSLV